MSLPEEAHESNMLRTSPILAVAIIALASMMPLAQVHASTQTITFSKSVTFDNITVTASGTITIDTTAKTITGSVTITAVNDTSGQTIFSKTIPININFGMTGTSSFVMLVPSANQMLAENCRVMPSTGTASCMVSKNPDVDNQGTVNIVDIASIAANFGTTNTRYALSGDSTVSIIDVAIAAADFGAPVFA